MGYFRHRSNPEAVLNKAKGTVKLGDKEDAWNIISEYLGSRNKKGWRSAVHDMMILFVELCVDLRKNPKDGFIQYRHHCSTLHLDSLEGCLRELIEKATTRGEEEHKALLVEFEDKDLKEPTVKKLYIKRQFSLASLKFQWSVYRCVLDVLRNNQKLDPLYQETVRGATRYCVMYNRTSEYRKLCDVNRKHLNWIFEHQTPGKNFVEIGTQNMVSIYLNTRFSLLENATKLQLWQEAYRLIGDIYQLRQRSTVPLDPSLEKNYYNKLAQIFIGSNNVILHAYAVIRYFVLLRDEFEREAAGLPVKRKKDEEPLTEEVIRKLAMKCVLATCATPPPRCRSDTIGPAMNSEDEKFRLMCDKLNFHSRPNQKNLLEQLEREEICDNLPQLFTEIQRVMLSEGSPLTLCQEMKRVMQLIVEQNPDLQVYMEPMKQACARKLISAVSKMYKSIPMKRLLDMICFDDWTQPDIESLLLELTRKKVIWCSMSHKFGMCTFRAPPRITRNRFMRNFFSNAADEMKKLQHKEGMIEDLKRGNFFENIRNQITLDQQKIKNRAMKNTQKRTRDDKLQRFKKYVSHIKKKEVQQKEQQNKAQREQQLNQQRESALKAIQERLKKEKAANEARVKAKRQLKMVNSVVIGKVATKTKIGTKKLRKLLDTEGADTSKAAIDTLTVEYLEDIKQAQEAAVLENLKFQDYYVRACRQEEIPLIRKHNAELAEHASGDQETEYKECVQRLKEEHGELLKMKKLAWKITPHTEFFKLRFEERREKHFQAAFAIQMERKEKHDAGRAEVKAKITEKRRLQQERNKAAKEAERRRTSERLGAQMSQQEKSEVKEDAVSPQKADAGRLGAPRLGPNASQTASSSAPSMAPGPPRRNADGSTIGAEAPGPARRNADGSTIGSSGASGAESGGSWRVAGKDGKIGKKERRRFTNSKKAEQEAEVPKKQETEQPRQREESSTPTRSPPGRIRPDRPTAKPTGGRPRFTNSSKAAVRPAESVRPMQSPQPAVSNQSLRPERPIRPTRSPQPVNVRPVRPPAPGPIRRPAPQQQSLRPQNPGPISRPAPQIRTSSNNLPQKEIRPSGIAPSRKSGGWREKQRLRNEGVINPAAAIKKRQNSPRQASPRAMPETRNTRPGPRNVRPTRNETAPSPGPGVASERQGSRPARPEVERPQQIQTQVRKEPKGDDGGSPPFQEVTRRRRRKQFTNSRKP